MIKAACVNIDVSHPLSFALSMKNNNLDMAYIGVFNDGFRSDDEVKAFMERTGVEKRYTSLKSLAEDADIGFVHDCNWEKHIAHAMPFIEAGKVVFIDKPIVGSLKECLQLEELVKKGAKIIGSSSARYVPEIEDLKRKLQENNETIVTVFGTAGVDEFNYGVHIVEAVQGLLGKGALTASFLGYSRNGDKPAEQYLVNWINGVQVIYQLQTGIHQKFHLIVTTDKNIHHVLIDNNNLYIALLKRIEAFMKNKTPMASIEDLTEVVRIFLAAKKSRETNGKSVALRDLSMNDNGYDGYAFEKQYAINAIHKK